MPDATVLIATYNRCALLDETLQSLRGLRLRSERSWDAIVVDNNSTDATRAVVERHARDFPVPLRYVFEARQGRSSALNTGIATTGATIVAMTDDDVRVDPGWLEAACDALLTGPAELAYAGGPVVPIWESAPPPWLDLTRGDLWGTIAIQDHGDRGFVYEDARRVPLGANMAARRSLFSAVGDFRSDLGRTNGRLVLGQEVPELLARARAAGFRGAYLPAMRIHHHVPSARLTRTYFRTWWIGKGVSRSAMELDPTAEAGGGRPAPPLLFGVPRYLFRSAVGHGWGWLRRRLAGQTAQAFRHEMMLMYVGGYCWARLTSRSSRATARLKGDTTLSTRSS